MLADVDPILWMLIIPAIVLIVGGLIAYSIYNERKRKAAFQAAAEAMGLPFFPEGDPALPAALSHFRLFSQGRSRRISNVIHGDTEELNLALFDYRFTTGSGKHSHTHRQTVVYMRSPQLDLPVFLLCPEGFFHSIAAFFNFNDIDFETHPVFSRQFYLQGPDEEQIRQVFVPAVLDWMEEEVKDRPTIEAAGDQLLYFISGRRIDPAELATFMARGFEFYTRLRDAGQKSG